MWISTSVFIPGLSTWPTLGMFTSTGNIVTFWVTCACGSILRTLPSKVRLGNASTVMVTGKPDCTVPTSVSSTSADTCTVSRFAILRMTVPPLTSLVGLEMTVPSTASSSSTVPVIGARTCVSSIASFAVCRFACAFTTAAWAVAAESCAESYPACVIDWV